MELHESEFKGGRESLLRRFLDSWWTVWTVAILVVGVICGALYHSAKSYKVRWYAESHSAHSAWVKLTGRTDITYEEWMALRRAGIEVNTTTK